MPFQAPYQQKYPPTQKAKNGPSVWGSIFNGGGQPEYLYGGRQKFGQPNTGMFGANPALAGRLWQSPLQQVPRAPGPTMPYASRGYPNALGAPRLPAARAAGPQAGGMPQVDPGAYMGASYGPGAMNRAGPSIVQQLFDGPQMGGVGGYIPRATVAGPGFKAIEPGLEPSMVDFFRASEAGGIGPTRQQRVQGSRDYGSPQFADAGRLDRRMDSEQTPGQFGGPPIAASDPKAMALRQAVANAKSPQEAMAIASGVPLSESLAYARANTQPVARGAVPSVGSRNPSLASVNNINSQLFTDPTNIRAQFSSQLGQPSADESAMSAWEAMRNASPVTRESLLAQANNGGRLTSGLRSGIDDQGFNRDGRFFGGAVPTTDANGRVSYTTRAAADPGAAEREARRLQHMQQLRDRQGGDVPERPYLRNGTASVSSQSNLPMFENPTLQAQRKATQAERMAKVSERAATLASQRKENLAARQRGPSVMDMLMQRNPALAVRLQEVQQQGQIAQAQMGMQERLAQAENANRLEALGLQGQNQLAGINAQNQAQMGVAQLDAGTRTKIAQLNADVESGRITAEQAAEAARNLSAQRRDVLGYAAGMAQAGMPADPNALNQMWPGGNFAAQGQLGAVPGGIVDRLQQPPGSQTQQGPFGAPQGGIDTTKPIYAGGKVNEQQLSDIRDAMQESYAKAFQVAMGRYGLTEQEAVELINGPLLGNTWFQRTPRNPTIWSKLTNPTAEAVPF